MTACGVPWAIVRVWVLKEEHETMEVFKHGKQSTLVKRIELSRAGKGEVKWMQEDRLRCSKVVVAQEMVKTKWR